MIKRLWYMVKTPFIIGVVLGLLVANIYAYQQARDAANAAESASTESKNITNELRRLTEAAADAVDELKKDNQNQTLILCRLILGDSVNIPPEDEAVIERICQEEIGIAINSSSSPTTQTQPQSPRSGSGTNQSSTKDPAPPDDNGEKPDQPSLPEQAVDLVCSIIPSIAGVC